GSSAPEPCQGVLDLGEGVDVALVTGGGGACFQPVAGLGVAAQVEEQGPAHEVLRHVARVEGAQLAERGDRVVGAAEALVLQRQAVPGEGVGGASARHLLQHAQTLAAHVASSGSASVAGVAASGPAIVGRTKDLGAASTSANLERTRSVRYMPL